MSLGILGGTFNPVHFAHLRLAEEMLEKLQLDRVLLIPASVPPLKSSGVAKAADRLEMLKLGAAGNPRFEVLDLELKRDGPSYTVDTLIELRASYPAEDLWFLLGSDALLALDQWHAPDRLFELANFAVVDRPGSDGHEIEDLLPASLLGSFRGTANGLKHSSGHELRRLPFMKLGISASEIRTKLAQGASIRYLVPNPVLEYIEKHELYRENH